MHVGVVGAGVAGALLAWRLVRSGADVDVLAGPDRLDATASSGGLVRGFEPDLAGCRLAAASLAELHADPVLRRWAAYREIGSVYACAGRTAAQLAPLVSEVDARLAGSASVLDAAGLARAHGWLDPPDGVLAVVERNAGAVSPDRLRKAALADAVRCGATVTGADGGPVAALADRYDAVVVAAGRWTPALLAASGLGRAGLRTKAIQYGLHPGGGWSPPAFVDECTGLWGRTAADGLVLLGVPSDRWDIDPDAPGVDEAMPQVARDLATARFGIAVGPARRVVASADAYAAPGLLALRTVPGVPGLHTFAGGSGGAAKSALAASRLAAAELTHPHPAPMEVRPDADGRTRVR